MKENWKRVESALQKEAVQVTNGRMLKEKYGFNEEHITTTLIKVHRTRWLRHVCKTSPERAK